MNRIRTTIDVVASFEIWKRGVPLRDADWHYAPAHLLREYNAIRAPAPAPLPVTETPAVDLSKLSVETFLMAMRIVAEHTLDPFNERCSVRRKMWDRLCRSIKSGELYAYGFYVPRKPADVPLRLPIDMFELRSINSGNSLKSARLEFVSVTVIRASEAQEIESRHPADSIYPAIGPKGRPTMRIYIRQAINSMYFDGYLPNDHSRKANAREVRRRVLLDSGHAGGAGLGESVLCKALKAAEVAYDRSQGVGNKI
jgi:hypothetical protein